jgi:hypothetical protein
MGTHGTSFLKKKNLHLHSQASITEDERLSTAPHFETKKKLRLVTPPLLLSP